MWFMSCLANQVNRATSMTGVDPCTDYEEDQPVASAYVNDVRTYKSVATHVDRSNAPVASVQFVKMWSKPLTWLDIVLSPVMRFQGG